LIVATTDKSHSIRCNMLKHLSPQFDYYLSSKENLLLLFNCMNDSSFEIRDKTLRILGRLADSNKAVMYPYLRNLLVSFMNTIEFKSDPQEKEEAIKILNTFIKRCKRVVKDHVECLLTSLLNKMSEKDFNFSLMPDIIEAIGQLSTIDGAPVQKNLKHLIPLILDCIKDEIAPRKREIGLKVLIMIIENTGYVVKPFFHYPELIQLITTLIQNETNFSIRKLVYKLFGTLGALDPYLISKILVFISVEEDEELALNLPLLKEIDIMNNYASKSSIRDLSKQALMESKEINSEANKNQKTLDKTGIPLEQLGLIIENQSLRDIHKTVLDSYIYIFKKLKNETKSYLNLILPPLLKVIRETSDDNIRKDAFEVLKTLIMQIREHTARYSASIFSLINEFLACDTLIGDKSAREKSTLHISTKHTSSLSDILEIIGVLNTHAYAYVKDYIYFLIPKVLQVVEKGKKKQIALAQQGMSLLITIQGGMLDDYLYLIIPEMISISSKSTNKLKDIAAQLLLKVIRCKHFEEYIVQIVHSFIKVLDETSDKSFYVGFLLEIGRLAGNNLFTPFVQLVLNAFQNNKINEEEYEAELQALSNNSTYKANYQMMDELEEMYAQEEKLKTIEELTEEASVTVEDYSLRKQQSYNFVDLLSQFEKNKNCKIHDDWIDWLKKTSYHLLKQNPSPLLYACSNVAEMYLPIIPELYNIAFVICFKHLNDKEKEGIITCLISVINNVDVPVMVLQTILNLAEYLEREEELKLFAPSTLARVAERCNASAKALYYKEKDFDRNRYDVGSWDALISINFDLQQPEAANGLLKLMHNESLNTMKEDWYLKLHEWSEALNIFEQKGDELSNEDILGKLQ
jgi:FKBP12-rapamycin complex-associated protein